VFLVIRREQVSVPCARSIALCKFIGPAAPDIRLYVTHLLEAFMALGTIRALRYTAVAPIPRPVPISLLFCIASPYR